MTATQPAEKNREQLEVKGVRITPQRLLVLQILGEAEEHLNAEAIWMRAQERGSRLSLATVYRTLVKLKEMKLVEQRYFARNHRREYYEAIGKEEHYYFTCVGCGRVIEVRTPDLRRARQELSEQLGLLFTHTCLCFEGYCAECVDQWSDVSSQ